MKTIFSIFLSYYPGKSQVPFDGSIVVSARTKRIIKMLDGKIACDTKVEGT